MTGGLLRGSGSEVIGETRGPCRASGVSMCLGETTMDRHELQEVIQQRLGEARSQVGLRIKKREILWDGELVGFIGGMRHHHPRWGASGGYGVWWKDPADGFLVSTSAVEVGPDHLRNTVPYAYLKDAQSAAKLMFKDYDHETFRAERIRDGAKRRRYIDEL